MEQVNLTKLPTSYYMLKLDEGHMNVIHVQMMNQQDSMKVFPLLLTSI
jgi:hypothetical protein